MGLDMYLSGAVEAPAESKIAKVIEKYLTDEERSHVGDIEWSGDGSTYIGGWDYDPHQMYKPLCLEMGFTPHEGSPHFDLFPKDDGWEVRPIVYYWRKANAIHRWFVETCQEGVDECQSSPVHSEVLMDLVERLERIHEDHSLAPKLLPTQAGFFFGDTEYDEWYFQDITESVIHLKAQVGLIMHLAPRFYYQASW